MNRPVILGTAAAGLQDAGWAKSAGHARAGAQAEKATAAVLDAWARRHPGVAVLHDLDVPRPGYTANVDHVVVSGSDILIIDSKAWAPGFVWSLGGKSYRGLKAFPAATKRTLPMAIDTYTEHLARHGITGVNISAALVVWCSRNKGAVSTWALSAPGARVASGPAFAARPSRLLRKRPADATIVNALARLIHT